jgi:uncharacterized membrane protein
MPDIAVFHPQLAHFVIALTSVGVVFRLASLIPRMRFLSLPATVILVAAALFAYFGVKSGDLAHEAVEGIPGITRAMDEHRDWGIRTRNLFIGIAALEIISLAFMAEKRRRIERYIHYASALAGLVGIAFIYETGEHGGALVYSYGAGVGTRLGKPEDVERALVAGLYNAAWHARQTGRKDEAARLFGEIERMRPNEPGVKLLIIESMIKDRNDPNAALAALRGFAAGEDRGLRLRVGSLRVDAFQAAGNKDSTMATINQLIQEFPANQRLKRRAARLDSIMK